MVGIAEENLMHAKFSEYSFKRRTIGRKIEGELICLNLSKIINN